YEKPEHIWSAGGVIKYHQNVAAMRGYRQQDQGQFQVCEDVDYLPGCAMLINSQVVKEVGYLDEIFSPVYFEDLDWCLRAQSAGYRILYEPKAEILHKVSMKDEYNPTQRYLFSYNSVIFMKRYANTRGWIKFIFLAIFSLPFVFILRSFQGEGKLVIARGVGILDALLNGKRKESFN
ncbi:glycosyltransferase family 2 protein, partial [Chloroflexota bacterium]